MNSENVLEETPVWSTTQEVLAHGHECSKICDGVGGEVVKLSSEKVQESSEKRMWRKREPTVDMGSKKNTFIRQRLRL